MSALHALSAAEMSRRFAARELSPLEVARAVIAQIERHEPTLCALYAFDAEPMLAMAQASEARWHRGEPLSALDGVPVTIKENIATRGVPLPLGTAASLVTPARDDAPPAARLREAGCVFVAKTTMPDYGMLSSGLSSFHKLARNPWDPRLNPGGSSAGAAAAAAAGYGPLHLGTDIGGSIRLPAGWCGAVGFKPSLGRIPIQPPYAGRVAGPITRSVEDAALMMAPLSRPDWRDTMSLPAQDIAWSHLARDPRPLRIGLLLDAGWGTPASDEVREVVRNAARAFEAAGAMVEPVQGFSTREMADGMDRFWRMRSFLDISALPAERRERVLPYILQWVDTARTLTAAEVFHGYSQMGALRDAAVAACQPFDYVLSPVSPEPSYPAEWASPLNDPLRPFEHIAFTLPYNMSEQPAITVDAGTSRSGLPIGLQIIGHRHDDLGVLQAARLWEQLRPPQRPWPLDC